MALVAPALRTTPIAWQRYPTTLGIAVWWNKQKLSFTLFLCNHGFMQRTTTDTQSCSVGRTADSYATSASGRIW